VEIVVVGAHYDSVMGSPGANDNASGVAALLELAKEFCAAGPRRTLRLVAFVNEEPPFFKTGEMGSLVYARAARAQGEKIVAMVSLETIGYYSEAEGSQEFPFPPLRLLYPTRGNFVAFVGNFASRRLLRRSLAAFREAGAFPAEGLVAPEWLVGVDWSDHWSFWRSGYPAIMITDTAPFRYQHYHSRADTPDKLDYGALARVTTGLREMVEVLCDD
jgi:Zn-dependent M28 family amino/carboxypeptidase